jgi:hypothetical protein
MSSCYWRLVDVDVSVKDAPALCKKVIDRLRKMELITGRLIEKRGGYLPGTAITKFKHYRHDISKYFPKPETDFYDLIQCGVEPIVGRHYNVWALPEAWGGATCSACGKEISSRDQKFFHAICDGVQKWEEEAGRALIACPKCKKKADVTKWQCRTPLGFGNLSFSFWNWPEFDSEDWNIDIPAIVGEVTGHKLVTTYGLL